MSRITLDSLIAQMRLFSVQAIALLVTLNGIYMGLPDHIKEQCPDWLIIAMNIAVGLYGYVGRQIPQPEAVAKVEAAKLP